jgi:hypothetical protein
MLVTNQYLHLEYSATALLQTGFRVLLCFQANADKISDYQVTSHVGSPGLNLSKLNPSATKAIQITQFVMSSENQIPRPFPQVAASSGFQRFPIYNLAVIASSPLINVTGFVTSAMYCTCYTTYSHTINIKSWIASNSWKFMH